MTTPADLLAIAERIKIRSARPGDVDRIVQHILATVHPDDDEPVTVEWVKTFARNCCNGLFVIDGLSEPFHIGIEIDEEGAGIWIRDSFKPGEDGARTWINTDLKTRGQVRSLLKALNVEAK